MIKMKTLSCSQANKGGGVGFVALRQMKIYSNFNAGSEDL